MKLSDTENTIINAMARAFFVCAWADRQEEKGKTFPGHDLTDVAPKTPKYARDFALMFAGQLIASNGASLLVLLDMAAKADGYTREEEYLKGHQFGDYTLAPSDYAYKFGHYVAMQGLGHGVSWFDDHAQFNLKVPHTEFYI